MTILLFERPVDRFSEDRFSEDRFSEDRFSERKSRADPAYRFKPKSAL